MARDTAPAERPRSDGPRSASGSAAVAGLSDLARRRRAQTRAAKRQLLLPVAWRVPAGRTADLAGAALVAALAAWVAVSASDTTGSRPGPMLALLAVAVVVFAVGRLLADREPLAVVHVVAVAASGALLLTWPGLTRAGGAPLGYANANATLAALGAIAAVTAAASEPHRANRGGWIALSIVLAAVTALTASVAGMVVLAVGAALLVASALSDAPVLAVLGGAICLSLALGLTVATASGADPTGVGDRAEVRVELWTAAADLAGEHPLRGVGPGRFQDLNPVSSDADLRWAHHGYLQVAAETGLVGLALLLALVGWGYGRLGLAGMVAPGRASVGAATLTAVALHASVDHVLHEAAVPLTLALLLGATTAGRRPPRLPRGSSPQTSWVTARRSPPARGSPG